jgi:predicted CXXCH cytochrome family protein
VKLRSPVSALAVVVVLIGSALAAKHPVPLDKDVKDAQCLQCHEDKTQGAHVHTAVSMGCLSCHEVRVNRDVTRVKLTKATTTSLCLSCHEDKKQAEGQTIHPPAVRDCVKCHDPHMSANPNQLLKPTSGSTKDENLCLSCHNKGVDVPKDGSRHAALDMGCETCHITHKNGPRGKQEFDYHLKSAVPALCIECHDPKDAALQKAHQDQPFGNANCTQCHDPHQSKSPKLLQAYTHNPFANNMCDTCHQPAKDGKVVLTNTDTRALCVTCHSDQAEKMEKAKVQHPGALGDCTACHNPHAGKTPGFLQPDPVAACLACHSEQSEQMKKAHLHKPAFVTGCATCHEPHGGDNQHLLRAGNINTLCLECHGPDTRPQKVEGAPLVTIFNGQVKLPDNYFATVTRLPIKYGLGHPVDHHPVVDQMDPTDVTKVRAPINCASCHQPHASAQADLLVNDQANNMAFCASCHKNLGQ